MSDRKLKETVAQPRQMFVSKSLKCRQLARRIQDHQGLMLPFGCSTLFIKYVVSTLGSNIAAPAPAITTAFHLLEEKKMGGEVPLP